MRSFAIRTTFYSLIISAVALLGLGVGPVAARSGITVGLSIDGAGQFDTPELEQEFGRFLESQLSIPVKIRRFTSEAQLYVWLTRFREVDVAWLSNDFLVGVPDGQLFPLTKPLDKSATELRGEIVARQGMQAVLRQQIIDALLRAHEISSGNLLLSQLGLNRFVTLTPEQESSWQGGASPSLSQEIGLTKEENDSATMPQAEKLPDQKNQVAEVGGRETGAVSAETPVNVSQYTVHGPHNASQEDETTDQKELTPVEVGIEVEKDPSHLESPKIDQRENVSLAADYLAYNSEDESYEAKGDVILRQADVELKSETLLWQSVTQDAAAKGSVSLRDAGTEISGQSMQYNLATGQGQISDGRIFVRDGNFRLIGEQIEKHSQSEYFVKEGNFTTCDGDIPDWKFSASDVEVTLGGYAKAKNVWFHVKDVPVLYTPYMSFPVRTERESGFLMPSFGYSNNKGTRASVAWYQVIDRHMDATIYLDYYSDIGLGKGLEYRYALANQNDGRAFYQHVTGFSDIPDLYYLEWGHRGKMPGDWQLTADIEYVNDKIFFEEFGEVAEDYNRDKTVSRLMLRRNWQKLNLVGSARYTKDLEDDDFDPLQRLPELGLGLARYRLGDSPFYAGMESYVTRFWRDDGEDGERLYLRPSIAAVFKPGNWLEIAPELALYERIYNAESEDDEDSLPEFSLAVATRLVRDFEVNRWGVERLQHSIEPKAVYTYVPDEPQDDLPLFDLYDRIERQNDITYALVNRLIARSRSADGSRSYRELLNLRLSQSYDIDEERNNRSGDSQPFSDVRAELAMKPTTNISMDLDGEIPVYGNLRFRTLSVGASVRDDSGNSVKVDYTYKDIDASGLATDYVSAQLTTSILKPVHVRLEERYDFRKDRELEKVVGLEYRGKCWSVFLTYRNRYREFEKDDTEVMFSFVLSGLGMGQGFGTGF